MNKDIGRHQFAIKLAALHFLISIVIASLSATLVWKGWYTYPFASILQVDSLFKIIIAVDVVCGPLLTLVLASPKKSRLETAIDLSLVATIQIAALLYGLHALYISRPVAVAFEKDRYVVVTANEIIENNTRKLPFMGVDFVNVRPPKNGSEKAYIIELFLLGLSPATLTSWWQPYDSALPQIKKKAKPLSSLLAARPQNQRSILSLADKHKLPISELRFLPLVHSKDMTWIAVLNKNTEIVECLNIDGFI